MKSNVLNLSKKLEKSLKKFCDKLMIAGSIRRGDKNPGDLDFVLIPKDIEKIKKHLLKKGKFISGGEKRSTFKIEGIKVELYYTTPESWGATLLAYSSEKGAAIGLRKIARSIGFHLNQYGLYKNGRHIAGKTEKEIYIALGRNYKSPRNR